MADTVYSVVSDTDKLTEASGELDTYATTISQDITDIYGKIDELASYWVGKSYDNFAGSCKTFKPTLDTLVAMIQAFSAYLGTTVVSEATTMDREIKNALGVFGTGGGR